MKSKEYLSEIRTLAGLPRAVLKKITLSGQTVTFHLVTDKSYSAEDQWGAQKITQKFVPEGYTAQVNLVKSVPSEEGIRREISLILKDKFPSAAAFVSPEDIAVDVFEGGGRFYIGVDEAEKSQFNRGNVLDALTEELNRKFCGSWLGDFRSAVKDTGEIEREELPPEELVRAPRMYAIREYVAIDGANPKHAMYIADLSGEQQGITLCGTINYIEERVSKNNKPYFSITITDFSGQLRTSYFSKKATLEKVRSLKRGDSICLTGDNELYNGNYSFRVKSLDFGMPPKGYEPESRPSRPAPMKYTAVSPVPMTDMEQSDLFGKSALPASFLEKTFVVFDLETTGLKCTPAGGVMDRIIEVGAVKIVNGCITEKFSTFVACPVKLSPDIVKLTGIRDEMLVGAPTIEAVIPDFYKFCEGCLLVGHNVQFDYSFIRHYGEREDYLFNQNAYDTVVLAQEELRLKNYKLNTVADHFGFDFNHHRAFDDAYVTAKIFIELIRLKGKFIE